MKAGGKLRIGIVGAGSVTEAAHLPYLSTFRDVEIVGIADVNIERAKYLASKFGIPFYTESYAELVKDKSVDIVDVCTPPFVRSEIVELCGINGKDVIVEKPLALDVPEALKIQAIAEATGIRIGMVFPLRYAGFIRRALVALNSKEFGQIENIIIESHTFEPHWKWMHEKWQRDYGVLYDLFPHLLDLVTWMTQAVPVYVFGESSGINGNNYTIMMKMRLPSGKEFVVSSSLKWTKSCSRRLVSFYGTSADLHLDLQDELLFMARGYLTPISQTVILAKRIVSFGRRVAGGGLRKGAMRYHKPLLRDFISSLSKKEYPSVSLADGILNCVCLDACKTSLRERRTVNIDSEDLP